MAKAAIDTTSSTEASRLNLCGKEGLGVGLEVLRSDRPDTASVDPQKGQKRTPGGMGLRQLGQVGDAWLSF
jgi:hypothetical protein